MLAVESGSMGVLSDSFFKGSYAVSYTHLYDINVNKFNNPGYPEIPTPGTDPDEEDGSFLAIPINVNPWTWYTQEEEF